MYQEALKRNPADPVTYSRIGAIYLTVAETARSLAARPAQGQNPDELRKVLDEKTILVSVIFASNEIGTIQPIKEIADIIRNFKNSKLENRNKLRKFE